MLNTLDALPGTKYVVDKAMDTQLIFKWRKFFPPFPDILLILYKFIHRCYNFGNLSNPNFFQSGVTNSL